MAGLPGAIERTDGSRYSPGSIPGIRTIVHNGQIRCQEVNTMENEPIYRVKVEIIGQEPKGSKISEDLRGVGRM